MKKLITLSIALLLSYVVQAQFYNNGGTLSISTGGILHVNNAFTNKSGGNLVNNGTLNVKGNLTNEQTMSNPHNGTLHLSGSSPQTIGGTAALLVKNLTFNNAAGISLLKSLKADGEVQFQSGIVAASSSAEPLAFTSNGLVSATNAPSNTSHVNGYVLREGTGAFDFPVGDGTRYQKVGTNLTANGSGLLAKYNASDAGTGTFATTGASATALTSYNTQEHWDISPLSTATGAVTIHWDDYKTPTLTDVSLVKVAHKSGANWLNQGGTGTGTTSTGSVTSSSVSTWSPFTLGLTAAAPGCPSGNTLYVNASVSGGAGDGSSWANAYASLSNALAVAHACNIVKTIKVAQGTYKPTRKPFNAGVEMTTSNSRDITFHIPDGVTMEGGYNATTGSRDIAANVTTLSGDIGTADIATDNAYHVVLASAASSGGVGVTIDGFSITGGNASEGSTITVNGNTLYRYIGGGIYTFYGMNTLSNNTLYSNSSGYAGAGIRIDWGNNTLTNNTLYNNTSLYSSGISVNNSTNTLTNNTLHNNTASDQGGGIYSSQSTNTLSNNTLYNNTATNNGGGIYLSNSTNTLSNNIFWGNKKGSTPSATVAGADVYTGSSDTFKNNLLQLAESSYTSANNNALGAGASGNIFNQDPLFVNAASPAGADSKHRTADDGLALQISSPGINAGTTGTGIPTTDITGAARVGNPDMGAYEAVCTTPTFSVGIPTKPTTCGGTNGSIPLTGLAASTSYSISYQKDGNSAVVSTLISNASGELTIGSLGAGSYTNITVTLSGCTSAPATASLANPPSAMATISGTTNVCQNAPNPVVTFTGSNGTAPYTFSYRINGGTVQTLTTSGGSSSATLSQNTSTPGVFSYVLESVNDAQSCGQNQSGTATITVQGKPTISLNALQ
ncbi:MAG TPA: hypothetical protein DCM71_14220, partial [Runella sp.]|nr:hypothetical protein [Runella sp.]